MENSKKDRFFTQNLMLWHKNQNKREMPWKGEAEPYKIWLSEIILQQTRVEQGTEYYLRFIKKFPTVTKLALAEDDVVFKLWEGLGYYSRCKNLLVTARKIAFEQKGIFPKDYVSILNLKGVGPYTAAAIASFAYNLPHAVADGNVLRVLARYYGVETAIDSKEGKLFFTLLAQSLLPKESPSLHNQAIMDFGATICKPKLPLCSSCILNSHCTAFKKSIVHLLPVKINRIIKKQRRFYFVIAEFEDKIYVRKRTEKDIWENLWEFILFEIPEILSAEQLLKSEFLVKIIPDKFKVKYVSGSFKQHLTHQLVEGIFIHVTLESFLKNDHFFAVNKNGLAKLAFPRIITNYFETEDFRRFG